MVDLTTRSLHQLLDPVEVPDIDDSPQILGFRIVAVEFLQRGLALREEVSLDAPVHQHVVGRNASLPSISQLHGHHALGSLLNVCTWQHKNWRLPTQFESYRRQVFCCSSGNDLDDHAVARVDDVVPL